MATSEISTFIFIHIDNIPTGRLLKTSSRHPQATFLYIEKQISVVWPQKSDGNCSDESQKFSPNSTNQRRKIIKAPFHSLRKILCNTFDQMLACFVWVEQKERHQLPSLSQLKRTKKTTKKLRHRTKNLKKKKMLLLYKSKTRQNKGKIKKRRKPYRSS